MVRSSCPSKHCWYSGESHLLPGVDSLTKHDRAVGSVAKLLQRHVPVHRPHGDGWGVFRAAFTPSHPSHLRLAPDCSYGRPASPAAPLVAIETTGTPANHCVINLPASPPPHHTYSQTS